MWMEMSGMPSIEPPNHTQASSPPGSRARLAAWFCNDGDGMKASHRAGPAARTTPSITSRENSLCPVSTACSFRRFIHKAVNFCNLLGVERNQWRPNAQPSSILVATRQHSLHCRYLHEICRYSAGSDDPLLRRIHFCLPFRIGMMAEHGGKLGCRQIRTPP